MKNPLEKLFEQLEKALEKSERPKKAVGIVNDEIIELFEKLDEMEEELKFDIELRIKKLEREINKQVKEEFKEEFKEYEAFQKSIWQKIYQQLNVNPKHKYTINRKVKTVYQYTDH